MEVKAEETKAERGWIKFPGPCLRDWMIFMIFAGLSTFHFL